MRRGAVWLLADGGKPAHSDFSPFGERERILYVHTQVAHGVLDLGVPQ